MTTGWNPVQNFEGKTSNSFIQKLENQNPTKNKQTKR
jgi:hypothetical protein